MNYIFIANNRKGHGIHSPFVFALVTNVFRNKTDRQVVSIVENARKRLLRDHSRITVNDLGAGSGNNLTKQGKVSEIAGKSPVSPKYGALLAQMASEFGRNLIIELGTSFGISTMYMALAAPKSRICTIEGSNEIAMIAERNFRSAGIENVELFTGSFEKKLPEIARRNEAPGLVFIDGDHRKEQVLINFNTIKEISDSNTVIIIDDINYSAGMNEAWEAIKKYREVTLTIDIFRMGIVFFRKGLSRSHYTIRY